jgi:hypothetical protein
VAVQNPLSHRPIFLLHSAKVMLLQLNDTFCSDATGLCIKNLQPKWAQILFWKAITGVASLGIYAAVNVGLVWSALRS